MTEFCRGACRKTRKAGRSRVGARRSGEWVRVGIQPGRAAPQAAKNAGLFGRNRTNGAPMQTLTSALDRARRLYGPRKAIVDRERSFTWTEFCDRVARAAAVLQGLGVKRGDRYAVLCRNTFRNNELLYAGYWMGAVPVPINYRLAPPEIRYILDNAACKVMAVETVFLDFLKAEPLAPWRDSAMLVAETPQASPLRQYEALMAKAAPAPMHDARRRGRRDPALYRRHHRAQQGRAAHAPQRLRRFDPDLARRRLQV